MTGNKIVGERKWPASLGKPGLMEFAVFAIAVSIFSLILLNYFPILFRPLSLSMRTGLNPTVILIFFLLYGSFRIPGRVGTFISLTLTLSIFALALAGLWAIAQTQPTILSGIVPLFDAGNYYIDALRLLSGQDFSIVSARRPLFPGMLAVVLWATQYNLMAALGVFTLISAIACYLAAKQIQRTSGAEAAVLALIILFLYYRYHSGAVMTENLGFPLGVLGFALLWRGAADRSQKLIALGLLVFTLALNARAGTFFVLPAILVWGGFLFKQEGSKFSSRFFALGSAAVLVGFAVNLLMVRLLATPSGVPFANFSYSLYGLASGGKSWNYVFETRPEINSLEEPYQSKEIYRLAFELIRDNPALFIRGIFYNWYMLFADSGYSAYSYVGGESDDIQDVLQGLLFFLCAFGFLKWFRKPGDPLTGLVAVSAIGILLSVPFLPPTDASRMRPYAASIIVFGLLPGMGLSLLLEFLKIPSLDVPDPQRDGRNSLVTTSITLLFVMVIGPVLIKSAGAVPIFNQAACEPGLALVSLRFDSGSHVNILRQNEPVLDWIPNVHLGRFRRNSHSLPDSAMINWATRLEPRSSLFSSLDYNSMRDTLILTPTNILPEPGTLWQVCGEFDLQVNVGGYQVFNVLETAHAMP